MVNANAVDFIQEGGTFGATGAKDAVHYVEGPRRRPIPTLDDLDFVAENRHRKVQPMHEYAMAGRVTPRIRMTDGKYSQLALLAWTAFFAPMK